MRPPIDGCPQSLLHHAPTEIGNLAPFDGPVVPRAAKKADNVFGIGEGFDSDSDKVVGRNVGDDPFERS